PGWRALQAAARPAGHAGGTILEALQPRGAAPVDQRAAGRDEPRRPAPPPAPRQRPAPGHGSGGIHPPPPGPGRDHRPLASRRAERAGLPTNGPARRGLRRERLAGPGPPDPRPDRPRGAAPPRRLLKPSPHRFGENVPEMSMTHRSLRQIRTWRV